MTGRILRPGSPKDILAAKYEIEKEDIFHFKNMFEWLHDWFEENEWIDTDEADAGSGHFEHHYWEKRMQNGNREHRVWWRLQKYPQGESNNYFRYVLIINFRNLKAEKVEIVHKGQKVQTWRSDLTMQIEAWLQLDYKDMWTDHWLMKHLDKLYRERIWKRQMDKWKKDLWRQAYEVAGWIKDFLDLKSPFELPAESYHPQGGLGPTPQPPGGTSPAEEGRGQ